MLIVQLKLIVQVASEPVLQWRVCETLSLLMLSPISHNLGFVLETEDDVERRTATSAYPRGPGVRRGGGGLLRRRDELLLSSKCRRHTQYTSL